METRPSYCTQPRKIYLWWGFMTLRSPLITSSPTHSEPYTKEIKYKSPVWNVRILEYFFRFHWHVGWLGVVGSVVTRTSVNYEYFCWLNQHFIRPIWDTYALMGSSWAAHGLTLTAHGLWALGYGPYVGPMNGLWALYPRPWAGSAEV